MCIFKHQWIKVDDVLITDVGCKACFTRRNKCAHEFQVCGKCGKWKGYGSHGKLSVVPDTCKKQIRYMGGKF